MHERPRDLDQTRLELLELRTRSLKPETATLRMARKLTAIFQISSD